MAAGAERGYCVVCCEYWGNGVFVLREREPVREWRRVKYTAASRQLSWYKVHQERGLDWEGDKGP